ncbi:CAF17-like 4Fe-4S cluster assembly/insertion protein YgfZ [Alkalicaulis satelles]|nr:folate-binding protein YgfZ [Alkalicaulis satelles]
MNERLSRFAHAAPVAGAPDALSKPGAQAKYAPMSTPFLTALPARAVIALTGPEARSFLQRVITRGPEGIAPDSAMFSALLTPQGKVLADFLVFDDGGDGLLFDVPASEAESLVKRFTLYRLRAKADIVLREDLSAAAALGEGEAELKTVALASAPDPRSDRMGLRAIVPAGGPVEAAPYHAARIAAIIPEFGEDYAASEVFSTDVNHDLLNGIDYRKGCFVGQEVASRMHRKGGVRKRTVRLDFDGDAPARGTQVMTGETPLGAITSVSARQALAILRIDRLEAAGGGPVTADGLSARVTLP